MPRGSRPGERRGGRQQGTPNKKTVLRNAVLSAAAAYPNVSPLDFMLGLMRNPNVPTDLRVEMAAAAAAFVHTRPKGLGRQRADPTQPGSSLRIGRASTYSDFSPQKMEAGLSAVAGSADLAPLDFLSSVMNDPEAAIRQRIKAARVSAPYRHAYAHPEDMPVVIEDPFGFNVDPAIARAIRDDRLRSDQLRIERLARDEAGYRPAELELRARIDERVKTLRCPAGYGPQDCMNDQNRMHKLHCRRISPPPYNFLTELEDAEEAHLIARVAAYKASPEGRARDRISHLSSRRSSREGASAAEQSELDELRNRYPDPPDDPNDPMARSFEAWAAALQKSRAES